ncbi:MAG: hypothetical protein K1X78_18965 [Verrucomicrobiaceae bacterium]|nr:hypothetical protein [Verrucomicrobiaceae bacterium]
MTRSYERINYALRPAKAIERRMLCETFGRLYPFQPVDSYGYIGFGSIYFSDFQLIHRNLGINDLLSIERDEDNAKRFEMNLPYGCISMDFRESGVVLPTLNWNKRRVVWLDYDGTLDTDVLADAATLASKATSGTMIVFSVNAHPVAEPTEEARKITEAKQGAPFRLADYRLSKLQENLPEKIPTDVTGTMLDMKGTPQVLRRVLLGEINAKLAVRNGSLPDAEQLAFVQVLHFVYQDGAQMLTLGGVLVAKQELAMFEACRFGELPFYRQDDRPFPIKVPCLTPREMHQLNSFLPSDDPTQLKREGIPDADVKRYAEVYRYFPNYSEIVFA